MPNEVSAGVVLYYKKENIRFLLLHYEAGHWDFPKGHVENNEKLRETALRETKEETNLNVELDPNFERSLSYIYRSKDGVLMNKTVHFFLAESKTSNVTLSHEHVGYSWLSYEKALTKLTFDNAKEVLKKAHKYLTQKTLKDFS